MNKKIEKKKTTKKTDGKDPAGRRAVKRAAPGQAADVMKTLMSLERIKVRLIPFPESLHQFLPDREWWESFLEEARGFRGDGFHDEDVAFYFIACALFKLTKERREKDVELARIEAAIEKIDAELAALEVAIEKKEGERGLEGGEAPEDVKKLDAAFDEQNRQLDEQVRRIEYAAMRDYGENEIAELFQSDEKEFYRRYYRGALLVCPEEETRKAVKRFASEFIIMRGWADLLPGLDM